MPNVTFPEIHEAIVRMFKLCVIFELSWKYPRASFSDKNPASIEGSLDMWLEEHLTLARAAMMS